MLIPGLCNNYNLSLVIYPAAESRVGKGFSHYLCRLWTFMVFCKQNYPPTSREVAFDHNYVDLLDELSSLPMVNNARKAGDKLKLFAEASSEVITSWVGYASMYNLKILSITTFVQSLENLTL
jgi:hypothetical protein